jgi:uncharacterized protein YndB with AHSA1/START domain
MKENIRQLNIVREINAPREQVYKAWTDPELLKQWWGPNGVTNPVCELDLRPGGSINIVMLAGSELGDLIPPSKLVYSSSAVLDGKPILDTTNTLTLEDHDGKTKMTLNITVTRTAPEAEGPLSGMEVGWNQSLDKLIKQVEN